MIRYTKKELAAFSAQHGFPIASIEKTMRLLELLKEINKDNFLCENIALKGGTAINLVLNDNLPRLSVDLDFDLSRNTSKEEMFEIRQTVETLINHITTEQGYEFRKQRPNNFALIQTELYYQASTGNKDKIKLDINCLSRCHPFEAAINRIKNPFTLEEFLCVIQERHQLYAGKLKALIERNTPRDIFDTYIMAKNNVFANEIDKDLLRKCLVYALSLRNNTVDIEKAIREIRDKPISEFKKHLFPMLKTGYGYVDNLTICNTAANYLQDITNFTQDEQQYLNLAKEGEYRPNLLFDPQIVTRIANNPAAQHYIIQKNRAFSNSTFEKETLMSFGISSKQIQELYTNGSVHIDKIYTRRKEEYDKSKPFTNNVDIDLIVSQNGILVKKGQIEIPLHQALRFLNNLSSDIHFDKNQFPLQKEKGKGIK